MRTFKLTLAYDGTNYAGWQSQPDRRTVQGSLESALLTVTGKSIRTMASGRTDAGVHAVGQVVGFRSESRLEPDVLLRALNANLPHDIRVVASQEAAADFHPIRDARRKIYRYFIDDHPVPDPFERHYVWQFPTRLDETAICDAARALIGRHDFVSFQTRGSERESTVRAVSICVERQVSVRAPEIPGSRLAITVSATGFLYNMVRNIVGTLVEVGRGSKAASWVATVLQARDRRAAGPTAPPQGLFLWHVEYDWH